MSDKPTQKMADEFHLAAKAEWDKRLKASGKSKLMFTVSHEAVQFLGEYQGVKESIEAEGLTIPALVEGTQVSFKDGPESS